MATKIRLQRHGRKGYPFYKIVIADSRAPRDGKFIERIGSYNPNTNPATVDINFDRALYWLETGAEPTDTARHILSREGVLLMKHLRGGVKKGAFNEEEAQRRFEAFIQGKKDLLSKVKADEVKKTEEAEKAALEAEKKFSEDMKKALEEKKAAEAKAKAEAEAAAKAEAEAAEAPKEEAAEKEA
ncbi:30S ribosomal protein S16 [Falsiporphyromonas endometrii]|uniref:Small ribosomal subunit protein bS16 n=1 Tax=Falsiporphyromonas endometrii TaxID=1387297 RepID=A0ABV9K8J3_9PORP|nr:30S ribosomal protein S16 [Porphyromonadaceae bacterium]